MNMYAVEVTHGEDKPRLVLYPCGLEYSNQPPIERVGTVIEMMHLRNRMAHDKVAHDLSYRYRVVPLPLYLSDETTALYRRLNTAYRADA